MTAPKRDPRAVLATGGLLLIPLAALWLVLSPRLSPPGGPPSPPMGGAGMPDGAARMEGGSLAGTRTGLALPAARVAAGAPAQADWTLLAVTRLDRQGIVTPPPALAPPAAFHPLFVLSAGAGTGLWIGVRGGLGDQGVKTLTIPVDGRPHAYPFGHAVFVVQSTRHSSGYSATSRWTAPGGAPLSGEPPYQASFQSSFQGGSGGVGRPAAQTVTLTPLRPPERFRVTAQPLAADGRPVGRAVGLLCQPAGATALFTQIPSGYGAGTRQFRVTAARVGTKNAGKNAGASWRLTDLPPSTWNGPDSLPAAPDARVGPFALHAAAAEAEDTSGGTDFVNRQPERSRAVSSQNLDGHQWTGVPTIRCLLLARTASPTPAGQSWVLRLDRVTPQWSAPLLLSSVVSRSPTLLPLTRSYVPPDAKEWVLQDGQIGAAYPSQQHWIKIDGMALRSGERTETLTFHDAEVVHDAGFGGDRLVWRRPETETTPSGISVTVLNGRPGRRDTTPARPFGQAFGQDWWYDRGNAELLLAWRLPPGVVSGQRAARDAPRVAEPPQGVMPSPGSVPPGSVPPGAAPLLASWDRTRPDPYAGAVAAPGATDARRLTQAGSSLLRLSVWAAQAPKRTMLPPPAFRPGRPPAPEMLPPYSWREGFDVLTATPLPHHLKTLTLQITLREEQEQRPVHLVVPVRPSLPPGADPNAPKPAPRPAPRAAARP